MATSPSPSSAPGQESEYYSVPSPIPNRTLKLKRSGICFVGRDGVFRSFDGQRNVVDAIALSPQQIKKMLDRMPWDQETEEKFRGIDGRAVTDHKALFDPEDEALRPPKQSEEEKERIRIEVEEMNRRTKERIEQERKEGIDVDAKYACRRNQSDYDLDLK